MINEKLCACRVQYSFNYEQLFDAIHLHALRNVNETFSTCHNDAKFN